MHREGRVRIAEVSRAVVFERRIDAHIHRQRRLTRSRLRPQVVRHQELASTRKQTVFGVGNPEAKILFIQAADSVSKQPLVSFIASSVLSGLSKQAVDALRAGQVVSSPAFDIKALALMPSIVGDGFVIDATRICGPSLVDPQ